MSSNTSYPSTSMSSEAYLASELETLIDTAEGFLSAKYLAVACFACLIYDHLMSFDQEVEFFWTGEWSFTRILYFLNRYLPIPIFLLQLIYFFDGAESLEFCTKAIKAVNITEIVGILICEAILVVRVYYLWSKIRIIQALVCFVTFAALAIALGYAGDSIASISALRLPMPFDQGCLGQGNGKYLPIFIPVLILSTFLFTMTVVRLLRVLRIGQDNSLSQRLLRDGALFQFVVVSTISLSVAGSTNTASTKFSIPILLSNFLYTAHSVCASHLILGLHSLAADLGDDVMSLLSNFEMSRLRWRKGNKANELVVEIDKDCADQYSDLINLDPLNSSDHSMTGNLHTSRIGTFDEPLTFE